MTKSRTLRKAGAVALSLAMAMSIVGVTPASAAAKKVTLSKAKGTIQVGKTATVKIKGTKKANIKKVTFKYTKAKIAKATRKNLKITIKGLKAGKTTVKAVVKLKKKVGTKKKYTLKYVATVKKAATPTTAPEVTATPGELALESVEGSQRVATGTNTVVAYFSAAVADFSAADVEIRRVSDDRLYTVEKVVTSSDKKVATMALTGTSTAGAINAEFLQDNVDYKLIVKINGKVYEKVFSIPAVDDNVTIVGYDISKKTVITRGQNAAGNWIAGAGTTYNVPESITVDYAGLLGNTVTIKYDKTNTITSIAPLAGEQTIYGAFKEVVDGTNRYVQDKLTETKYYNQDAASGIIPPSRIKPYETGVEAAYAAAGLVNNTSYAYGKLVLNTNGTIKFFATLSAWSGNIYVGSVNGDSIISKTKQEQTLKDWTILKDGKTIKVADIKEGDVVFYNTTVKLAEVYNNVSTGKIQQVYDGAGFKFDGKDRNGSNAQYISGGALKTVDTAYLKTLGTEKDVTVIFGRDGNPVYVLGEQAASTDTSTTLVLTAAGDGFAQTTSNFIRLKGFDGTAEVTKDIDISTLAELVDDANSETYKSTGGKFIAATGANAGVAAKSDWSTATTGEYLGFEGNSVKGTPGAAGLVTLTDLGVGKIVVLTANDKGAITKLQIKSGAVMVAGAAGTKFNGAVSKDFKKGYTNIDTNKIADSANVYVIAKGPKVTKTTYGEFDKTIANAALANITQYTKDGSVTDIVIDNQGGAAFSDDADGSSVVEGVVKEVKYLDEKMTKIVLLTKDGEKTYEKFGEAGVKTVVAQGAIVDATVLKDGVTVNAVAGDGEAIANIDAYIYGVSTNAPGSLYVQTKTVAPAALSKLKKYNLKSGATLTKIKGTTVSTISLSDLKTLAYTEKVVLSTDVAGGSEVDTVVVVDAGTAVGARATTFAAAAGGVTNAIADNTASGYMGAGLAVTPTTKATLDTAAKFNAAKAALADYEVIKADWTEAKETPAWSAATPANYTKLAGNAGAVAMAAKYNVVAVKPVTDPLKATAANNANITQGEVDAIAAKFPASVHVTMVDGSEKDVAVWNGTFNATTGVWTPGAGADDKAKGGLFWDNTDGLAATDDFSNAATTKTITLTAGNAGATPADVYVIPAFSFEVDFD